MRKYALAKGALEFRSRYAHGGVEAHYGHVSDGQPAKVGPWLSADSAARYYDFSTSKAFRSWADRHHLVPAHMGRRALYAKADIDALMKKPSVTRNLSLAHGATVTEASDGR